VPVDRLIVSPVHVDVGPVITGSGFTTVLTYVEHAPSTKTNVILPDPVTAPDPIPPIVVSEVGAAVPLVDETNQVPVMGLPFNVKASPEHKAIGPVPVHCAFVFPKADKMVTRNKRILFFMKKI
jgi:hypothetical protein